MKVLKINKTIKKDGSVKGSFTVEHQKRKFKINFHRDSSGHAEQWGAPTEILCKTYSYFEKVSKPNN